MCSAISRLRKFLDCAEQLHIQTLAQYLTAVVKVTLRLATSTHYTQEHTYSTHEDGRVMQKGSYTILPQTQRNVIQFMSTLGRCI